MYICKTCGADDLIKSDVHGDFCIYCAGDIEHHLKLKAWREKERVTGVMTCFECGKEVKSLCNDKCTDCYNLWQKNELPWQKEGR